MVCVSARALRDVGDISCDCMFWDDRGGDPSNGWGEKGRCNKFVPVLGGDGTKIVPTGNIFDNPLVK